MRDDPSRTDKLLRTGLTLISMMRCFFFFFCFARRDNALTMANGRGSVLPTTPHSLVFLFPIFVFALYVSQSHDHTIRHVLALLLLSLLFLFLQERVG